MKFGNCYLFSWRRSRLGWGCVLIRRSLKSWVPHSQWSPLGVPHDATLLPGFWSGLLRIMGPRRGYLILHQGRVYWRARIDDLYILEFLPPWWVNRSISASWWCRTFPLHAVLFCGRVRSGFGEHAKMKEQIRRKWPHDA